MPLRIGSITIPATEAEAGTLEGKEKKVPIELDWLKVIVGFLVTIVGSGGVVAVLPFLGYETPTSEAARIQEQANFTFSVLEQALRPEDALTRARSLRILLTAGVITDEDGNLQRLIDTPDSIPHWQE